MKLIETGIYQLNDGRFRVKTSAKCPVTHSMVRSQQTVTTLKEARHARESFKEEIASRVQEGETRIITLADYAEEWWASKEPRLKASTATTYERALIHRILPELGHIRLQSLTRRDILAWVAWAEDQRQPPAEVRKIERELSKGRIGDLEASQKIEQIMNSIDTTTLKHYGSPTVHKWWRVLVQLLKDAHADGFLVGNVIARVTPPSTNAPPVRELGTLEIDELGALIKSVKTYSPQRYAEVVGYATTGMRPGEMYALQLPDLNYKARKVSINKSVWNGIVGTTKTGTGREVPMADIFAYALIEHRKEMLRTDHPGLASGLVFPSDAGTYREPSSLKKCLDMACEDAKIKQRVTPQVLRRTFNTLLIAQQVDRIVIRATMGHSSEEMTERYAGVPMEMKLAAVDSLATSLATKMGTDNFGG